jgi:pyrroline-5-carboxylate reductase
MFKKELGIIGVGKIGSALISRFISTNIIDKNNLIVYDINEDKLNERCKEFDIECAKNNAALAKSAKYILIAVIPQVIDNVLNDIASEITEQHTIISIAAGVSINHIKKFINKNVGLNLIKVIENFFINKNVGIIRIMTNTPALVGAAATALSSNKDIKENEKEYVKNLFNSVGIVVELDESLLDAVTGLSGSGPAYIFIMIEALADGGVKMGIPRDISQKLAAQTLLGSAKLLLETNKHPGELKDMVATPGGTTITAIHEIESAKLRATLIRAVEAATLKSKSLNSSKKEE